MKRSVRSKPAIDIEHFEPLHVQHIFDYYLDQFHTVQDTGEHESSSAVSAAYEHEELARGWRVRREPN